MVLPLDVTTRRDSYAWHRRVRETLLAARPSQVGIGTTDSKVYE